MPPTPIDVHRLAAREARSARRWYAGRSPAAAQRFVDELRRAFQEIGNAPTQWPPHLYGTRVFRLNGFPYLVIYFDCGTDVKILAVSHGSRHSGYWRRRLSSP
jgi:plasmid stabilization system protein ParE